MNDILSPEITVDSTVSTHSSENYFINQSKFKQHASSYGIICIYLLDSNCIKVLAPDNMEGDNQGHYEPGEHIGHLRREWAAKLAPILDFLFDTDTLHNVTLDCNLKDNDTTHDRNGYWLNVVVLSSHSAEFNTKLSSFFSDFSFER
jgi:hypothetical protein